MFPLPLNNNSKFHTVHYVKSSISGPVSKKGGRIVSKSDTVEQRLPFVASVIYLR